MTRNTTVGTESFFPYNVLRNLDVYSSEAESERRPSTELRQITDFIAILEDKQQPWSCLTLFDLVGVTLTITISFLASHYAASDYRVL